MKVTELARLARLHASRLLPRGGVNKKMQITRLLFEIAKRNGCMPREIMPQNAAKNFEQAKNYLLAKRYPLSFKTAPLSSYYLPDLDLNAAAEADLNAEPFYPKKVYIERGALAYPLAQRVKKLFPLADFKIIEKPAPAGLESYSRRRETLVITKENFDFIKPCPCTKNCVRCGYNLINLGFGCAYECSYCFLQQYQNLHAIALPANINDFLNKIDDAALSKGIFPYKRIGSGEFTDSLLFDHITNYCEDIVNFFRARQEYFEFKTKSANIDGMLKLEPAPNIVVGWSVNPQNVIETTEALTPSLQTRLEAAAKIAAHGFKTAFHFDPVILHPNWKRSYAAAIEQIADTVPPQSILWISVGTLRFNRELKKYIEARFKKNTILDAELLLDFDGKLRYPKPLREEAYRHIGGLIKKYFPRAVTYLCMEEQPLQI